MEKTGSSHFRFLKPEVRPCPSSFPPLHCRRLRSPPGYLQQLSPSKQRPQFSKALKHKLNYQDKLKGFAELGLQS